MDYIYLLFKISSLGVLKKVENLNAHKTTLWTGMY